MSENYRITGTESQMTPGLHVFRKQETTEAKTGKVRVAAYCRVSTNLDMQKSSLDIQMASYERIIKEHPGWKLAGIYTDKGISGTSAERRVAFKQMIEDAKAGKIDYIIAKSTSRFARNTVDTLKYTRMLKEMGVGVYFEEQKIDTSSIASEMLLTIHAAFAQEESHSLSENLKKGYRSRFAMGIPKWSATYGYKKLDDGTWVPDEEKAQVVRRIFNMYLNGFNLPEIVEALTKDGVPGPGNKKTWFAHSLSTILHNEKYIGDVAMQKDYTIDHINHKRKRNSDASIPRFYKKDHHQAIVDRESFYHVQKILEMRDPHKGAIQYPFFGSLVCPYCGEKMMSVRLPSRYHHQAWFCAGPSSDKQFRFQRSSCQPFFVKGNYIEEGVVKAFKALLSELPENVDSVFLDNLDKHKEKVLAGRIHYMFLYELTDAVTFAKDEKGIINWNTIQVNWKCGITTYGCVEFKHASEIPVTRETAELRGMVYYANGEPTNGQTNAYYGVIASFDFCDKVRIIEETENEKVRSLSTIGMLVPTVIAPNTKKKEYKGDVIYEGAKDSRKSGDKESEGSSLRKGKYA